jgi:hypothetical protein
MTWIVVPYRLPDYEAEHADVRSIHPNVLRVEWTSSDYVEQ